MNTYVANLVGIGKCKKYRTFLTEEFFLIRNGIYRKKINETRKNPF